MELSRPERLQSVVFLAGLFASCGILLAGSRVEVDDVYIVLRAAENLAAGHGMVFSPGDAFMPVTCPLWTLLLGLARISSPEGNLVEIARVTSILFTCCSAGLFYLLLRPTLGWGAVLLAPMILFAREIPEHVGNEIGLASSLVAGTLLAHRHGRAKLAAGLAAAAYLTRGEGVLLLPLLFGLPLWRAARAGRLREHARSLLGPGIVFLTIAGAWHLYHLAQFGSVMPKTLAVKVLQGRRGWQRYGAHVWPHVVRQLKYAWPIGLLCLCGLRALARSNPLLLGWAALHVAFYSALRVPNYDWYYYPLFFVVPIAAVYGLATASAACSRRFSPALARTATVAAGIALAWLWVPWPIPTANGERVAQYRAVADWLRTREDAAQRPLVMAFEIGIIGYYARDLPMIDPPGILVPDLTKELLKDWPELIRRHRPVYLVFREALGPEVRVGDTVRHVEHRYELVHEIPGDGYPQHIYRIKP